jgi:hypothetical protein
MILSTLSKRWLLSFPFLAAIVNSRQSRQQTVRLQATTTRTPTACQKVRPKKSFRLFTARLFFKTAPHRLALLSRRAAKTTHRVPGE